MRKNIVSMLICLLAAWVPLASLGELDLSPTPAPQPAEEGPALTPLSHGALLESAPLNCDCAAMLLAEMDSGQVIFAMNPDSPRPVASVTKLMTILLTLEALDAGRLSLEDEVVISKAASGMGGSQVLLDTGETQTVRVLLESMIVGSANDAAVALAEALYGSEEACVARMNRRAEALGMDHTHFENCTGLPAEGQHTTARDVAVMSREVFSHPVYFDFSTVWMKAVDHGDGRTTQLVNTNKLLRLCDGCDGGKTGSTGEAGYCVSATALRGGMRLVAVVLGAPSGSERFDIAQRMLDYGFANYRRYPVAQRGARVRGELPVTGGVRPGVALRLDGELTLLLEKGMDQNVRLEPRLPESASAPVSAGEILGSVAVLLDGRVLSEIPLAACEDVPAKGLGLRRLWRRWLAR